MVSPDTVRLRCTRAKARVRIETYSRPATPLRYIYALHSGESSSED